MLSSILKGTQKTVVGLVRFTMAVLLIFLNSLIIAIVVNRMLSPYETKIANLNFYMGYYSSLNSRLSLKCRNNSPFAQCIDIDRVKYGIKLHLDVANRVNNDDANNYEVELKLKTYKGDVYTIKKVFFFKRKLVLNQIITTPYHALGFGEVLPFDIDITDSFDNKVMSFADIEIEIKTLSINIEKAQLVFTPHNSLFRKAFYYIKYPVMLISFWSSVIGHSVMICILYVYNIQTLKTIK